MAATLEIAGLNAFKEYLDGAPDRARKAASIALNQVANRTAVPRSRDLIQEQIDFPSGYLNGDRLSVTKPSSPSTLEVKISGRDRPTSLLRFATRGLGNSIASVQVRPGNVKRVRRGFVINLRSGNQGFAVRLKQGETLTKSVAAKLLTPRGKRRDPVYLLYGPSVNQAFLSVAGDLTPVFLDALQSEFLRQFTRDNL